MRNALRFLVPKNTWGDRMFAMYTFLRAHRRFPTDQKLFNDVLYRLKSSGALEDPLRVFVTDKEHVKLYVKAVIGDEFNVPTLAVLRNVDEIHQFRFPGDCCIKATHGSGMVILRTKGSPVNTSDLERWIKFSYYNFTRESNYKTLTPKIIVEPLIFGNSSPEDYKIFCYRGKAKLIQVDMNRYSGHRRLFFDRHWNVQNFTMMYPKPKHTMPRPGNLDLMIDIAERLSSPFDFIRIDLYSDGQRCFVGEITNCHKNATGKFMPPSAEHVASRILFGEAEPS